MSSPTTARRSMWSGSVSFGLVNIPVKLFTAVKDHSIHFHMLHDADNARLQRKMVCSLDQKEVHPEHTVRGFQVGPDKYVKVEDSELEAVAPEATRMIGITDFVPLESIDPVYFDRPYWLEPDEGAANAYNLLATAMERAGKVGVAKFVMRGTEYLAAIRSIEGVLCLETMRFRDEVIEAKELKMAKSGKVNENELKAAEQLIESLATEFKPEAYHDDYRARVLSLIDKKKKGQTVVSETPVLHKASKPSDLLAALKASIESAQKKQPSEAHPGRTKRKSRS